MENSKSQSDYLPILTGLDKDQKKILQKKLNQKCLECKNKYNSLIDGFAKNKVYREKVIEVFAENYQELVKPYRSIKTITYRPNKTERIAIIITKESYQLVPSRLANHQNYQYLQKESTRYIAIYQYQTMMTHNIIIAFRGTKQINDVVPDYFILRNKHHLSERFKESLAMFDQVQTQYPKANIYVCGHSLGGTLAIWVNQNRKDCKQCYAFNPGYNGYLMPKLSLKNDNLKIFLVKGDPLSNTIFAVKSDLKPKKNNLVILKGHGKTPLRNHAMDNFVNLV